MKCTRMRRANTKIASLGYIGIETTRRGAWAAFATRLLGMMIAPNMPEEGPLYLKMDDYPWSTAVTVSNSTGKTIPPR